MIRCMYCKRPHGKGHEKYCRKYQEPIRAKIWCNKCNMYYKPITIEPNKGKMTMICPICGHGITMDAPISTIRQFEVN